MNTRICLSILLTVSVAGGAALAQNQTLAQNKVRTETIRPPAPGEQTFRSEGHTVAPGEQAGKLPEIITNPARPPPAVAQTSSGRLGIAPDGTWQFFVSGD